MVSLCLLKTKYSRTGREQKWRNYATLVMRTQNIKLGKVKNLSLARVFGLFEITVILPIRVCIKHYVR